MWCCACVGHGATSSHPQSGISADMFVEDKMMRQVVQSDPQLASNTVVSPSQRWPINMSNQARKETWKMLRESVAFQQLRSRVNKDSCHQNATRLKAKQLKLFHACGEPTETFSATSRPCLGGAKKISQTPCRAMHRGDARRRRRC